MTEVVAWAAGNGDRSDNADYRYGKRRLRQIDSRIRFLTTRIDAAEMVDPEAPRSGHACDEGILRSDRARCKRRGSGGSVSILGTDEIDLNRNHISWVSPPGGGR